MLCFDSFEKTPNFGRLTHMCLEEVSGKFLGGVCETLCLRDFGPCKMLQFSLTNPFDPNFVLAPKFFETNILWPKMCLDQKVLNQNLSSVDPNFLDPTFLKKKILTKNIFRQTNFSDFFWSQKFCWPKPFLDQECFGTNNFLGHTVLKLIQNFRTGNFYRLLNFYAKIFKYQILTYNTEQNALYNRIWLKRWPNLFTTFFIAFLRKACELKNVPKSGKSP